MALVLLAASVARGDDALTRVLGGVERAPTAEAVRALGPAADRLLVAAASDGRTARLRRMRAIAALAFAPSAYARAFLLAVVRDQGGATRGADVLDVAAAAGALAVYGPTVAPTLVPLLAHASADVRQSAAAALGRARAPEAAGALRARLAVERDAGVHEELVRALARLQ
jgi:hypothetical protein